MKIKNKVLLISTLFFFVLYLLTACKDDEETTPVIIDDNIGIPCEGIPTVDYGGKTYNTVKIGNQCWMRQNLNIGTMLMSSDTLNNNDTVEKFCYQNDIANCDKYGGLYTWKELMNYVDSTPQGICPEGWHVPSDVDWKVMEGAVDSLFAINDTIWDDTGWRGYNAGGILKKMGSEDWYYPNVGATNSVGFSAVPSGVLYFEDKTFDLLLSTNYQWTSTKEQDLDAWFRILSYGHSDIRRGHTNAEYAFSVRCMKNQ